MRKNSINRILRTTSQANAIFRQAGRIMLKSSFGTAKELAALYKDAGLQAFDLSKKVLSKTVTLTFDNQKELLKTSGKALKEVAQSISENRVKTKPESQTGAQKNGRKRKSSGRKKEMSIDDLLD